MSGRRYLLVTPCRDEEDHLDAIIESIAAQTEHPAKWVIVDDGSTDRTPEILSEAAEKYSFIQVVPRTDRGGRVVGAGVIQAFNAGVEAVGLDDYDFVCKLDADLELPPHYFERMMDEMQEEPRLGNFSGKVYLHLPDGRFVEERTGTENAIGQAKFYRVPCFRDIGGFVPMAGWDGIDGHICRLRGWIARSRNDEDTRIVHRRLMGSSHIGVWHGRQRWGRSKWFMGSALYYIFFVSLYRMIERPFLIGGLGILWGYAKAMLTRVPRYENLEFRRALRQFEWVSLTRGKAQAAEHMERLGNASCRTRPDDDMESLVSSASSTSHRPDDKESE